MNKKKDVCNGQWHIKTMIGVEQCSLTKRHTNYSETQLVVAPSMLKKKKKRIPKNKQKIMVWGAFSIKGQLLCYSFRTTMDGPFYVEILRKHLLAGARKQFGSGWRYQQDNDPKHISKVAKQLLKTEVPETIDWPSNSPDINPIENIWSILKRRVEKRKTSNIHELDQFLHEEWKKFEKTIINNLVHSMKSRCLAIIESKGERINY